MLGNTHYDAIDFAAERFTRNTTGFFKYVTF